ncbi:hypothetical protein T459_14633 [Capsicum annuum]|uniref:Peptidase S9A N-terminal domain-containing protein n=1 Tax=Capsicum annuum TaxID=4072 RepID=A0A2G2ZHZ6_CAPAN|nr:hypothetical protein FXO37_12648 [Capsicum annuum]PHT81618.1 hypothetical protein T459_14633 [Capsicum annuum]
MFSIVNRLYYQYIPEEEEFAILCRKLAAKSKGWMKTVSSYVISFTKEEQVLLDWNGFVETYVSPDHNYIAYIIDVTGSEQFVLQIKDLQNDCVLPALGVEGFMSSMQPIFRLEFNDFVSVCLVYNTFLNIIMAFSMFSQILVMVVRNLHLRVESIIWLDALLEQMKIDELSPWFFPLPSDMCAIAPGSNHDFTRFVYRAAVSSPVTPDDIVDYDMSRRTLSVIQQEEVINISHMTKYHSNNEERSRNELLGTPLKKEDNIQNKEA